MIATTDVLMMRLSYRSISLLNIIYKQIFSTVSFLAHDEQLGGGHSYNILLHHILMK